MFKSVLPYLPAIALATTAVAPVAAQSPKPVPKPAAAKTAVKPKAAPSPEAEVVGKVGSVSFTLAQVNAFVRKRSPETFNQFVGQAIASAAAASGFGTGTATQFTITRDQVFAAMLKQPPEPYYRILQNMIEQAAVDQEATKLHLDVTDAQVNLRLAEVFKEARSRNMIPANMTDDQYLMQRHMTRAGISPDIRSDVKTFEVIEREVIEKSLGHPVGPTDYYVASDILVRAPDVPATAKADDPNKIAQNQARDKVTKVLADIQAKKITYEQAAKDDNDDNAAKMNGGSRGPALRGQGAPGGLQPIVENAVLVLKPGEMTGIIQAPDGFHIARLDKTGTQLTEDERKQCLYRIAQTKRSQFLVELSTRLGAENKFPPPQMGGGGFGPPGSQRRPMRRPMPGGPGRQLGPMGPGGRPIGPGGVRPIGPGGPGGPGGTPNPNAPGPGGPAGPGTRNPNAPGPTGPGGPGTTNPNAPGPGGPTGPAKPTGPGGQ